MSLLEGRRQPLWRAPATLCAIHAVELYLNVLLLHLGCSATEIRSYLHDLAQRSALAMEQGLTLQRRTAEHLGKMTRDREYLVSRYGPAGADGPGSTPHPPAICSRGRI